MKILNISLDKNILSPQGSANGASGIPSAGKKDFAVQKRILEYGELVEQYDVIVLGDQNNSFNLSEKVKILSVSAGNKVLGFLRLKLLVWKTLRKEKYDLITVQDSYFIGFLALQMARVFKIGLEIQVHGFEKFQGIRKIISKYVLKRADSVRVVSERLKKEMIEEFQVKENKIVVIPIYVELETRSIASVQNEIVETQDLASAKNNDNFIFLTVGRLVPVKNIEIQIDAVANLKDKFKNIELWIIGDGPERKDYELRIKKYGLEDRIKLLGYQNDLDKFYKQADVFLLTSNSEGYGMVIVEAANHGLPIIMTDVGCAGEFIKNEESGIVIDAKNRDFLEKAMIRLIENEDLRMRLGKNAQNSIKNLLNKEETLNLYKKSWEKAII